MITQSAAIGVACAGELYFAASFSVGILLVLLRFGPRQRDWSDDGGSGGGDAQLSSGTYASIADGAAVRSGKPDILMGSMDVADEKQPLKKNKEDSLLSHSMRKRASLGGIV
jgi:hypothetical protein